MTPLPFVGTPPDGGACPVQYRLKRGKSWWLVRYRGGSLTVREETDELAADTKLKVQIGDEYDGYMGAKETNVYLSLISKSIQTSDFSKNHYPAKSEVAKHPLYKLGPLPLYLAGLRCRNRHKTHSENCRIYVPAQDIENWTNDNPKEHKALEEGGFQKSWSWVCARLKE